MSREESAWLYSHVPKVLGFVNVLRRERKGRKSSRKEECRSAGSREGWAGGAVACLQKKNTLMDTWIVLCRMTPTSASEPATGQREGGGRGSTPRRKEVRRRRRRRTCPHPFVVLFLHTVQVLAMIARLADWLIGFKQRTSVSPLLAQVLGCAARPFSTSLPLPQRTQSALCSSCPFASGFVAPKTPTSSLQKIDFS